MSVSGSFCLLWVGIEDLRVMARHDWRLLLGRVISLGGVRGLLSSQRRLFPVKEVISLVGSSRVYGVICR